MVEKQLKSSVFCVNQFFFFFLKCICLVWPGPNKHSEDQWGHVYSHLSPMEWLQSEETDELSASTQEKRHIVYISQPSTLNLQDTAGLWLTGKLLCTVHRLYRSSRRRAAQNSLWLGRVQTAWYAAFAVKPKGTALITYSSQPSSPSLYLMSVIRHYHPLFSTLCLRTASVAWCRLPKRVISIHPSAVIKEKTKPIFFIKTHMNS